MSIIRTAFIAASLVVAAGAANAQDRGGLESGYHGNTPVVTTYIGGPKSLLTQTIRRSHAQAQPVRVRAYAFRAAPRTGGGGVNAIGADEAN